MNSKLFDSYWASTSGGVIPPCSFPGGQDNGGSTIIVARAKYKSDLIPGKLVTGHKSAYVPFGGAEHLVDEYGTLTVPSEFLSWVPASGAKVPPNAVPGGMTSDGATLYIGRASHKATVTTGKVHRGHGCLYIPYGGGEHKYESY